MILLLSISLQVNVINILNTLLIIFISSLYSIIEILNISCCHKKIFLVYMRSSFFKLDCLIKQMLPIHQLLLVLNLKSLLMVKLTLLKIILDHFGRFIHLKVEVLRNSVKYFIGIIQQIVLFKLVFHLLNFEYILIENILLSFMFLLKIDLLIFKQISDQNQHTNIMKIIYFNFF